MNSPYTRKNLLVLILMAVGCLALGAVSGITAAAGSGYAGIKLPPLSPPGYVFPIAWTILYILMAYSLWTVYVGSADRRYYYMFAAQLALNFVWVPLFFGAGLRAAALVDLLAIWILVFLLIRRTWADDRIGAYALLPYLAWLTFAGYLTVGALLLN